VSNNGVIPRQINTGKEIYWVDLNGKVHIFTQRNACPVEYKFTYTFIFSSFNTQF